jgi:glycosyltransferase involved in cell wall biosynthesis
MAIEATRGGMRRLALIGPSAAALARLRGGFIKHCVARGIRVLALAPEVSAGGAESLLSLGAEVMSLAEPPSGFTLFPERRRISGLADQLRQWHPSALLAFGQQAPLVVKAARRAGVPRVVLLLNEIADGGLSAPLRLAARVADAIVVHNRDDARLVKGLKPVATGKVRQVAGAGADLAIHEGCAMPGAGASEPIVFLAAARLDRVKGVHDYLEAARIAADAGAPAKFLLAGPDGRGDGAIKAETIAKYAGAVQYAGDKSDIAALIQQAHVFVCPSHREGLPHAVLEAMAAGRAIIATDIAGCRETVDEMVNGTLAAPGNPKDLAGAFTRLIRNRALLPAMGRASRAKAERSLSMASVNAALLDVLMLGSE